MKQRLNNIQENLVIKTFRRWGDLLETEDIIEIFNNLTKSKYYRIIRKSKVGKKDKKK